jgi:SAM-dependent methyltransferase
MNANLYNKDFYKYINLHSIQSANEIVPLVLQIINVKSILDVGCGQGAWLSVWKKMGVQSICGIDGSHVNLNNLFIEKENFISANLSNSYPKINRKFDLITCLEVAEHLPRHKSENFIKFLTMHSSYVLFSAAQIGQGGENHINENKLSYWAKIFKSNNFECYDILRPKFISNPKISKWYKYNSLLFVHKSKISTMHPYYNVSNLALLDQSYEDIFWRLRKFIFKNISYKCLTVIAKLKYKFIIFFKKI